jgi:hypothetical protein
MRKGTVAARLTTENLKTLRDQGFLYVLVNSYSAENRFDHSTFNRLILVPVRELPEAPGQKGIYASIDSEILDEWANQPDNRIDAFIKVYAKGENGV